MARRIAGTSRNHGCKLLIDLSGSFAVAVVILEYPSYAERARIRTPMLIWITTSAGADFSSAPSFAISFLSRSTCQRLSWMQSLQASSYFCKWLASKQLNIVEPLESGLMPALWTIISLALYLWRPQENFGAAVLFCVGRVGGLTLLYNLNIRKSTSTAAINSDGHMSSSGGGGSRPRMFRKWGGGKGTNKNLGKNHFELIVAVNTIVETKLEGGDEVKAQIVDFRRESFPSRQDSRKSVNDGAHHIIFQTPEEWGRP
ncbi:hypothetical protein P7C70_g2355, partial [Phenoliferia sp. Uapishka_3]